MGVNPSETPMPFARFSAALLLAVSTTALPAQQAEREQPADQQILHALNRLAFGPRPGDVQKVRAIGLDQWIEQQLHPERIDDSAFERKLPRYSTFGQSENALLRQYAEAQRDRRQVRADSGASL